MKELATRNAMNPTPQITIKITASMSNMLLGAFPAHYRNLAGETHSPQTVI